MGGLNCQCIDKTEDNYVNFENEGKNKLRGGKFTHKNNQSKESLLKIIQERLKEAEITPELINEEEFNNLLNENKKANYYFELFNDKFDEINIETPQENFYIGPMKFTNNKENLIEYYDGEFDSNGLFSGKGIHLINNGYIYKGEFLEDSYNGKGLMITANGDCLFGDWVNSECNGIGHLIIDNKLDYEGGFKSNKKDGEGVEKYPDGSVYMGGFKDGKKSGHGNYVFSNKESYIGNFEDDLYEGEGTYEWPNEGRQYKGEFKKGNFDGKGKNKYKDGSIYYGNYLNGKKNGQGSYSWPDGKKFFGNWLNNELHGNGYYIVGDEKYEVTFRFGKIINTKPTNKVINNNNMNQNEIKPKYNLENIVTKDNGEDGKKYICSVCNNVLVDPYKCVSCSNNICKECIPTKDDKQSCNKCNSNSLEYNAEILRELLFNVKLKCSQCEEILDYQNAYNHFH